MKNYIAYFYNLIIDDIYYINHKYFFYIGNNKYIFESCENDFLENYYNNLEMQLSKYKYFSKIIKNRNNRIVTVINGKKYILLKVNIISDDYICIYDLKPIVFVDEINGLGGLNRTSWSYLWEKKIDYVEEWIESKKEKYKDIYSYVYFFIGVAENALLYIKEIEKSELQTEYDKLCFQHNRINYNTTLYEYYDPANLIIDHSSRDVGEYIKNYFINNNLNIDILIDYLNKYNFSTYWIKMLYVRIIFPSFFFDYFENIMNNHDCAINVASIEKMCNNYLKLITDVSILLNKKYNIPIIDWVIKKV